MVRLEDIDTGDLITWQSGSMDSSQTSTVLLSRKPVTIYYQCVLVAGTETSIGQNPGWVDFSGYYDRIEKLKTIYPDAVWVNYDDVESVSPPTPRSLVSRVLLQEG